MINLSSPNYDLELLKINLNELSKVIHEENFFEQVNLIILNS